MKEFCAIHVSYSHNNKSTLERGELYAVQRPYTCCHCKQIRAREIRKVSLDLENTQLLSNELLLKAPCILEKYP